MQTSWGWQPADWHVRDPVPIGWVQRHSRAGVTSGCYNSNGGPSKCQASLPVGAGRAGLWRRRAARVPAQLDTLVGRWHKARVARRERPAVDERRNKHNNGLPMDSRTLTMTSRHALCRAAQRCDIHSRHTGSLCKSQRERKTDLPIAGQRVGEPGSAGAATVRANPQNTNNAGGRGSGLLAKVPAVKGRDCCRSHDQPSR